MGAKLRESRARFFGLAAAIFLLASCATPYQEMGFTGGVSATQIDSDTFRITAKGNGFTSVDDIQNYALLKAAETTLGADADYFVILGTSDRSGTTYISTPETATSTTTVAGNSAFTNTTVTGGDRIPIFKPGQSLMIRVFKGQKSPNSANAFDAREIVKFIGPKVRRR